MTQRERIYIDGTLMEQSGDKAASLVFQSPFFTEIDSIVGNRSNSVDFPPTEANLRALGLSHLDRSGSRYAARKHTAQYYLDGVQVFHGTAILQAITPTAIKFSFTWGNTEAFQRLLDIRLRDLQTAEAGDYITYTDAGIRGAGRTTDNIRYTRLPVALMTADEVLTRLAEKAGVSLDTTPFAQYRIPLLTRYADAVAKNAQGLTIRSGNITRVETTNYINQNVKFYGLAPVLSDSDLLHLHTGDGVLDVADRSTLRITIHARTTCAVKVVYSDYINSYIKSRAHLTLYACDEDGASVRKIADLAGCDVIPYQQGSDYYIRIYYGRQVKADVDVSGYSFVRFGVGVVGSVGSYQQSQSLTEGSIVVAPDPDAEQGVEVGGRLPLYYNLPDWTGAQLLKNLMKMEGVFPRCPSDTAVEFLSVDTLYDNRARAYDWTARLDLERDQPTERTSALQGYAQFNHFRYAKDERVNGVYDGDLTINDQTLEKEADLVTLDFAPTDGGDNPVIDLWNYGEGGWEFTGDGLTPRILRMNADHKAVFVRLDWPTLIGSKYLTYSRVVSRPRKVKARVVIDAAELATLDLSVPVYSYGAGCYWAITKLTTNGDGTATAELLRLGDASEAATDLGLPTLAYPTQNLVVSLDDNDDWVTRIISLTDEENEALAANTAYRIVLERWGYARRGKTIKYLNKYGKMQTTHAVRHGLYHHGDERYSCYNADGDFIGYDVLASVPNKGWAIQWWGLRKFTYDATAHSWTEASEGHIFHDTGAKGSSLPKQGDAFSSSYYGCYENTRSHQTYPKRWRPIGWDILLHGSEPEHSQTFNCGRYAGATLVCRLGDALVLPLVSSPTSQYNHARGKNGRVHNRAKNGLTELAVSLWHYEAINGGWVRVSNRVRVRSRNKDCTAYWEFDKGNELTI